MHSELKIVSSDDLTKRSYVCFYLDGKRVREFNGKSLGLDIKPNFASTIQEREKLLRKLEFELLKALENNNYPATLNAKREANDSINRQSASNSLENALNKKLNSSLSKFYKRNLKSIYEDFTAFLTSQEMVSQLCTLKKSRIEEFLSRYKSSGTYYMNKRRDLGVLFSTASKEFENPIITVQRTEKMKSKARLHKIYEKDQIKPILNYLKTAHPNLHLCCLISYGCFLRPHQEVRNLFGHHFKKDFTEIHLSGNENKGGKVRVVFIPEYVKDELRNRVQLLTNETNLFTLTEESFNDAYFNTAWTRAWKKMFELNLIQKNQTIYSFRHTAAVNIYKQTKDIHILQQLLGHSDMIVTLKYLRGLGEINNLQLKEYVPEL